MCQFDPIDKYHVMRTKVFDLNTRAILNGLMNEELKVIVAKRQGVPIEQYQYFNKARDAVGNGLDCATNCVARILRASR